MLKAVIVDDEIPVLGLLKRFLEETGQAEVIGAYSDPVYALEEVDRLKPNVVFLDIDMPELNGLEFADRLLDFENEPIVVFVTSYNQFALEAFKVNAIDYILKPVTLKSIQACITKLLKLSGGLDHKKQDASHAMIKCLGKFEVYGGNGLINWTTRKIEEMLAYFIIHRDSNIEAWQLGEVLWPEKEPDKMKSSIHTTLFRLRKTIKEEGLPIDISSEKGGKGVYRCSLNEICCDLFTFDDFMKNNAVISEENIHAAVAVYERYKGDLFANKHYAWCEAETSYYDRQYINLSVSIADYYSQKGEHLLALEKLERAAVLSPFDEVIHREMLQVYAAQHNRAMLVKCHENFKRILQEEIGVLPQAETESVFKRFNQNCD